jgi:hypothetical protein
MIQRATTEASGDVGNVPTSTTCSYFTDMELQWFHGTHNVVEVLNLITESDIVSEVDKEITLSPTAYLSALTLLGQTWAAKWGCHRQPPMLCGEVFACPTCGQADYNEGHCEDCTYSVDSRSDDYHNGADVGFYDDSPDTYVHVPNVSDDPTYDDIPF